MVRGFSCNVFEQDSSTLINTLLVNIPIEQYTWDIGGGESYRREANQSGHINLEPLFVEPYIKSGEQIRETFHQNDTYIIFLDLKAFPKAEEVRHIETLNDFLESTCELVILMIDSEYLAVYSKDRAILEQMYSNLQNQLSLKLNYFTDETNPLSSMIAW